MYMENACDRLEQHTTPEMLRSPLHEMALTIKLLRLGSIGGFLGKAIQPPPIDTVIEAEHLLRGIPTPLPIYLLTFSFMYLFSKFIHMSNTVSAVYLVGK